MTVAWPVWVRNGKAQNEHKFSGLPPKADLSLIEDPSAANAAIRRLLGGERGPNRAARKTHG
jgi:hypothetical protein